MTLSKSKVDVILARRNQTVGEFCEAVGISRNRFYVVMNSKNVQPKTAGRMAEMLCVDVAEIIEE